VLWILGFGIGWLKLGVWVWARLLSVYHFTYFFIYDNITCVISTCAKYNMYYSHSILILFIVQLIWLV